jgi:hypothetical protein
MNIPTEVQIALVAAVLILILVLIFKDRVAEIVFGPAKMTLFRPDEQKATEEKAMEIAEKEAPAASSSSAPHWDKVATLFWLGNDLMWITDMVYRGALPDRVLQGVKKVRQYLLDFGFPDNSFPLQQLAIATDILESLLGIKRNTPSERTLLKQHYTTVAQQIQIIKWYLNALAEQEQPRFEKLRAL